MAEFYPSSKRKAGEGHITILAFSYDSIGQGTWGLSTFSDQWLNGILYSVEGTDGDNISYKVYLDAGTYTLMLYTMTQNNLGIVDIDLNNTEVASFDLYTGDGVYNVQKTQTGIVIATPGLYTLKCRIDGKNENSDGYQFILSYIALWRTA